MKKIAIMIFVTLVVLIVGFRIMTHLIFKGVLDEQDNMREELTLNFNQHENDFSDLVEFFKKNALNDTSYTVTFGLGKNGKVSLDVFPVVIDPANKIVGGEDLELDSYELGVALKKLKWTNETVVALRNKLSKTNCDWIRTTQSASKAIELDQNQTGLGKFSYYIHDRPIVDSLILLYGKPLSNSEFGRKVILDYKSPL